MNVNTRMQAAAKMLKIYWSGTPCKNGHTSGRYVSTNVCVTCQNESNVGARKKNGVQMKVAQALGLVEVTVRVPPGCEPDILATASALVLQRDADRHEHMSRLIQLTNSQATRGADKYTTDRARTNAEGV